MTIIFEKLTKIMLAATISILVIITSIVAFSSDFESTLGAGLLPATLTDGGVLLGSGSGNITAMSVLADGSIVVGDGTTDPVALAAFESSTGDLAVTAGGTGVGTLTDGGVILGSGTSDVTVMAVLADGELIVGDGTTDPVAESGATLRTSIGLGTGDSPTFTQILTNGAEGTPAYSFSSNPDQGMYRVGDSHIGFSLGGSKVAGIHNTRGLYADRFELDEANGDVVLLREAASILQLGADVNGAAVPYTLKAHDGITGTDVAGANLTIAGGRGTGAGAPGQLVFQTSATLGSGTTAQTSATRFTITEFGVNLTPQASPPGSPAAGDIYVDSTPSPDALCFYNGTDWDDISAAATDANCA